MKILYRSLGLVAVLALSTLLHSCDKVKDAISINVPTQTVNADFYIAAQQQGAQAVVSLPVGLNLDSLIKIQNSSLGIGNIKSAKIKSISLAFSNTTATDHIGSFSACEVSLASSAKPDYTVIAGTTSIADANVASFDIPVKDVDLKEYFNSTSFTYKLSATVRRATTTELKGKATIKFDIVAGL